MEWGLVATWVAMYAALAAVGVPICAALFESIPGRGAAFAVPVSVIGLMVPVYWLGHLSLGFWTVGVALLVLVTASALSARRFPVPWRAGAEAFVVFLAGFLFVVALRSATPAIQAAGGEDFLHFGLLNAVSRAESLPPEDMWFAGEPVRYYFGGHLTTATLAGLTGTELRYAYNVTMAGYFGILVSGAYGLVGSVTAAAGRSRRLGGVLGAFFVGFGGSLVTAVRLGFGFLPESMAIERGRAVFGAIRHRGYEEAVRTQSTPEGWGWFLDRYVVDDALHEFPLYSFVKADHHGHTITTGFLVLAVALGYAYYRTPADDRGRRIALLFGAIPVLGGFVGVMNAWVLPGVVSVTWVAVALAPAHPATLVAAGKRFAPRDRFDAPLPRVAAGELWRIATASLAAVGVAAIAVLWGAPFLLFGTPTNDGIGLLPPRTTLAGVILVYGALLLLFWAYLGARWRGELADGPRSDVPLTAILGLAGAGTLVLAVLAVALSIPSLVLAGIPLAGAWFLARRATRTGVRTGTETDPGDGTETDPGAATEATAVGDGGWPVGFEAVLIVAGLGLVLSMDLVHARVWPPELVRWNTTLKVSVQAWTVGGLAAGAVAARWLGGSIQALRDRTDTRQTLQAVGVVVLCVAVVASSAPFAVLVATGETGAEDRSLDGLGTYERWNSDEMAAIEWVDDRDGTPTIVEAPGRTPYRAQNPVSTFSGVPTVAGWAHERGYRGVEAYERRAGHVDEIYTDPSVRNDHLDRYGVEYVVVGPVERERYGDGLAPFDGDRFEVAFENEAVTVYRVGDA